MANRLCLLSEWERAHAPPPVQSKKWSQAEVLLATIFFLRQLSPATPIKIKGVLRKAVDFFMCFFACHGKSDEKAGNINKKFIFPREMETTFPPQPAASEKLKPGFQTFYFSEVHNGDQKILGEFSHT